MQSLNLIFNMFLGVEETFTNSSIYKENISMSVFYKSPFTGCDLKVNPKFSVRENVMSFKRPTHLWAKNKEITDIQNQAVTGLTCLGASDVYNTPSMQRKVCCVVFTESDHINSP